jgi:hypothetical protein
MQKEIYPHSEHLRAWQDQGYLPEVQKRKGEAEHFRLYDQDQPKELRDDRYSLDYAPPCRGRLRCVSPHLQWPEKR